MYVYVGNTAYLLYKVLVRRLIKTITKIYNALQQWAISEEKTDRYSVASTGYPHIKYPKF